MIHKWNTVTVMLFTQNVQLHLKIVTNIYTHIFNTQYRCIHSILYILHTHIFSIIFSETGTIDVRLHYTYVCITEISKQFDK